MLDAFGHFVEQRGDAGFRCRLGVFERLGDGQQVRGGRTGGSLGANRVIEEDQAGGVLLVPLEAFIQARPAADQKGKVIAAGNFTAFIGIMLGGLASNVLSSDCLTKRMTPTTDFGIVGAITLLAGLLVWKKVVDRRS